MKVYITKGYVDGKVDCNVGYVFARLFLMQHSVEFGYIELDYIGRSNISDHFFGIIITQKQKNTVVYMGFQKYWIKFAARSHPIYPSSTVQY